MNEHLFNTEVILIRQNTTTNDNLNISELNISNEFNINNLNIENNLIANTAQFNNITFQELHSNNIEFNKLSTSDFDVSINANIINNIDIGNTLYIDSTMTTDIMNTSNINIENQFNINSNIYIDNSLYIENDFKNYINKVNVENIHNNDITIKAKQIIIGSKDSNIIFNGKFNAPGYIQTIENDSVLVINDINNPGIYFDDNGYIKLSNNELIIKAPNSNPTIMFSNNIDNIITNNLITDNMYSPLINSNTIITNNIYNNELCTDTIYTSVIISNNLFINTKNIIIGDDNSNVIILGNTYLTIFNDFKYNKN